MSAGADPIPAISEQDATGEIAAIFADLRATLGLPFVNLIWRHLATLPGGLLWTWTLVKPLYISGELERRSGSLTEAASLAPSPALPDFVWDSAGIERDTRLAIIALIDDYNHGNGVNFLALLTALSVLQGGQARRIEPTRALVAGRHRASGRAPPLPSLARLSPPVLALVHGLDAFGRLGSNDAVASLYRHLAHWPAFLSFAYTALLPVHSNGELATAQRNVIECGLQQRVALAMHVGDNLPPLADESRTAVIQSLDEFTGLMIGRMIVMGHALRSLLPEGEI